MTSISQERAALDAVGWWLRSREQARFQRSYTDARAVVEPATRVFVHITITNPRNYGSDDAHARAVESIGISRFPSTGISYNRLFMQSGTAYEGQPIGRRGAHTVNDFKRGWCFTGGCPGRGAPLTAPNWNLNYNARAYVICQNVADVVTDKQLNSLAKAIAADKLAGFVVRTAEIHGHRCVSSKSCPAGPMWARMSALEILVNDYLRNGLNPPPEDDMPTPAELWNHKLSDPHDGVARSAGDLLRFARIDAYKGWQKTLELDAEIEALEQDLDMLRAEVIELKEAHAPVAEPPA
jgi:hypothetical protein